MTPRLCHKARGNGTHDALFHLPDICAKVQFHNLCKLNFFQCCKELLALAACPCVGTTV